VKSPTLAVCLLTLVVALLTVSPIAMLVYGSLHSTPPGEAGEFSLAGYRVIFSRPTGIVLLNTIGLALVETGLSMALALAGWWRARIFPGAAFSKR
jgi:iron(III) transport system permease protein